MTNIVVFCGGRGSASILSSLAETPDVRVTALVNAYDCGLSTGRVRHAVPGLLGPSDVRKNVSTLAAASGVTPARVMAEVMEWRLSPPDHEAAAEFRAVLAENFAALPESLASKLAALGSHSRRSLHDVLANFSAHLQQRAAEFSFSDLAIGNAALAGCYLPTQNFDSAVTRYSALVGIAGHRVVNVTRGEDLWLSAEAGDFYCPDEGVLVAQTPPAAISDLFLLPRESHYRIFPADATDWIAKSAVASAPRDLEELPRLGDHAAEALADADIIVFGPGTQHSSLLPSYLTRGLAEALIANSRASKLLFLNAGHDRDQHRSESQWDFIAKIGRAHV